jgi:hypothetical protein
VNAGAAQGSCQCGAIRYEIAAGHHQLYVCHCNECRKQSASAFGISLIVARSAFRLKSGTPRFWSRPTNSGHWLDCAFCPDCGSRLWHARRGDAATVSVKGGSLDAPIDLSDAVHIWTARKLAGVEIPASALQFPGEPE